MRIARAIAVVGLALVACGALARASAETIERRLGAMGTSLSIRAEAPDRSTALVASERAVAAFEAAEARLSTWREDSELSRLNAAPPGRLVPLSNELARDLAAALGVASDTRGAFDPTVGALVRCWGLRSGGRRPSGEEIDRARAATGYRLLEVEGSLALRRRADVVVEEGAFGKGVGLDDAVAAMQAAGATRGLVDLGGQIASFGGAEQVVDLADPRDRSRPVLRLRFSDASVSISGNSERAVSSGGERIGHLLDPRTGRPARDFGSVAVLARSAAVADALSTALFVMGPDEAMRWAWTHRDIDVLVLEMMHYGLRARATPGLEGRISPVARDVHLTFDRPTPPETTDSPDPAAAEPPPDR